MYLTMKMNKRTDKYIDSRDVQILTIRATFRAPRRMSDRLNSEFSTTGVLRGSEFNLSGVI